MFKVMSNEDRVSVMNSFMEGSRIEQRALSGRGKWREVATPSFDFHKNLYRVINNGTKQTFEDELPLDERIEIANENMKEAIRIHTTLLEEKKMIEKEKAKNKNLSDEAILYLRGHSRDYLKDLLADYFIFQKGKSIVGKVLVTDVDGLLEDDTTIDTIIINVGGDTIHNFLGGFQEKKIVDGELMIAVERKSKRQHEKHRRLFNRKMRRPPVVEKLLEHGEKLDLGLKKWEIE